MNNYESGQKLVRITKFHVQFHHIDIKSSSLIQVPFLNLMANLQQRTGRINIRVGGNTQETATLVDSTPDGKILEKDLQAVSGTVSWGVLALVTL